MQLKNISKILLSAVAVIALSAFFINNSNDAPTSNLNSEKDGYKTVFHSNTSHAGIMKADKGKGGGKDKSGGGKGDCGPTKDPGQKCDPGRGKKN